MLHRSAAQVEVPQQKESVLSPRVIPYCMHYAAVLNEDPNCIGAYARNVGMSESRHNCPIVTPHLLTSSWVVGNYHYLVQGKSIVKKSYPSNCNLVPVRKYDRTTSDMNNGEGIRSSFG